MSQNKEILIKFDSIHKEYGDFTAVKEINLEIAKGELFGFLGPNGAGKTTMIRMLTGIIRPTSGTITIGGYNLYQEPIKAKSLIGYVPDRPYLYEKLSPVEYFDFMGGSMGSVVGEKVTAIMEEAIKQNIPMIAITASGGARMQESSLSLMQMAKTACAVAKLNENKILYITVLTEPTYGGVTASFATTGDIVIVEQGARIGFAGRRVIEQTIRQKLPADFQTAEYLMKYGQADIIVKRKELKQTLSKLINMHKKN